MLNGGYIKWRGAIEATQVFQEAIEMSLFANESNINKCLD